MGVHRTCGEPDDTKKNTHPKNITAVTALVRDQVALMEAAIAADDVIWHATALNFLPELLDEALWSESHVPGAVQ